MDGMTAPMHWANAISTRASLEAAIAEVTDALESRIERPDLGLVFISAAFASELSRLLPLLQEKLAIPNLVGCSGGGVVGMQGQAPVEIEREAALSLTLASLPDVEIHTFHVSQQALPDLDSPPESWIDLVGVAPRDNPQFILIADSMSAGVNDLLQGLDFAYPQSPKVGGLASLDSFSRGGSLFINRNRYEDGCIGLALSGNVALDTIVAQGCRPIGAPYWVAEAERNVLLKLEEADGDVEGSPLDILQNLLETLNDAERQLAQHSLFIGIAQDSFKSSLEPGDFLIRNLLGVDPKTGAIAVGDRLRVGQRVQFHLRDAASAAEDLENLLTHYQQSTTPAGALMFACVGRGKGLYQEPNFDSRLFSRYLKQVPLSGFFCNGEIGPIGGATFLHGYTSVFGICRQP